MRSYARLLLGIFLMTLLVSGVCAAQKKGIDLTKQVVVVPFESSVKGAAGLPDAVRSAIIQTFKDEGIFAAVLTPEEVKDQDPTKIVELSAKLVDFDPGNAGKRLLVGFGTGRAHAGFDFVLKDKKTGDVIWQNRIKQTASFWFNGTTSSAAERSELPDGVAKKLVKELKAKEAK